MRVLFTSFIFLISHLNCFSQKLVIENKNCKVSSKDLKKIERILKYEANLYNNLFNTHLNDTLTVRVNLYGDKADYFSLQGTLAGGLNRTNGFYTPTTDQCYIIKNSDYVPTVIHEASHFFLQHNLTRPSRFLTEGIAEFFETLEVDENNEIVFSAQAGRVQMVKQIVNSHGFRLDSYLQAENSVWGEKNQTQNLYSVAYSVVYYLIKKNPSTLKRALLYMQEGQSFEKAIEYSYGNYKTFESEYVSFYKASLIKVL